MSLEQPINFGINFGSMTRAYYYHRYGFMERKPLQKPNFTNIVYPLDAYTWTMLLVAFLSVSLALWIIIRQKGKMFQSFLLALQIAYGILFQEFHEKTSLKNRASYMGLRLLWVTTSMLITMAFMANLKSSLTKKNFEERTVILEEMIEKDMKIHVSFMVTNYLEGPSGHLANKFDRRFLCQIKKKNSTYIPGSVSFFIHWTY